ncbi:MAG TPA: hypothetical protein PKY82_25050 [Pyrinomonadaceae bacterium]|nr:hypothetical protein [Pyrinomonadaceae bacterium]
MRKLLLTIWLITLLFSACQKKSSESGGFNILSTDDTKEAVDLINDANSDLKKIKAIYKDNMGKTVELKAAMSNKENEKVKEIAGNLVTEIDNGVTLGESAYQKIEKAKELNINETYKQYLDMKSEALRKQLEAFEYRRKSAILLRDSFGGKEQKDLEVTKAKFKELDDNFQKLMEEGRTLSQDANELAKEAAKSKQ